MTRRLFAVLRQQPIALLALFVALGGTSFAAANVSRSSGDVIIGCVGDRSGQLRVVDSARRCGSLETAISFNREGEQGKTGARGKAGDDGTNGRAGTSGKDGASGPAGLDGANGHDGATGAAGRDGAAGPAGLDGEDGEAGPRGLPGADGEDGEDGEDASNTPSELLTALLTVDGTGSGLDADTVDGVHASALLTTSGFGALFGTGSQAQTLTNTDPDADVICVVGTVTLTAATFPPPNTMFAAGQTLQIGQNTPLFSLLGTRYGGNGTSNFKVPDLRQQAPGKTNYAMCTAGVFPTEDS
jgi:hypothetical protein